MLKLEIELAQSHTTEYVTGLEAGIKSAADYIEDVEFDKNIKIEDTHDSYSSMGQTESVWVRASPAELVLSEALELVPTHKYLHEFCDMTNGAAFIMGAISGASHKLIAYGGSNE